MSKFKGQITKHISVDMLTQSQGDVTFTLTPKNIDLYIMFEEFIEWVGRPVNIHGSWRSVSYNKSVKGNARSNHLNGLAIDFDVSGIDFGEKFVKYAKKWKEITSKHGYVGEAGLYKWGYHFGIQTYFRSFYHWDSRSGTQKNMCFKELI